MTDVQPKSHAERFMELVNSDAFDAAFEAVPDPFKVALLDQAVGDWFRLYGFTPVATPSVGTVIALPDDWPGDMVGMLTDRAVVAVYGATGPGDNDNNLPLDLWYDDYPKSEFSYFNVNDVPA